MGKTARLAALGIALPAAAAAHPSFSQLENNRYVKLSPMTDRLRLAYTVLFGPVPAAAARRRMDANADGAIDDPEARAFAEKLAGDVAPGLRVRLDGRPVTVRFDDVTPGIDDRRVAALPFAVDLVASLPIEGGGRHEVLYDDQSEIERAGETEIVIEEGPGVRILAASQGALRQSLTTRFKFRGDATSTGENRLVAFAFAAGAGAGAGAGGGATSNDDGLLVRLLSRSRVGGANLAWAALVAFALGALHALGPGHGKTIVAAYLVGSRATALHAAALGGVLTAAHVGSVLVFGAVALWATKRFVPERAAATLETIAGLAVLCLGLVLLVARVRRLRRGGDGGRHRGHGHDHGDQRGHGHGHADGDEHVHAPNGEKGEPTAGAIVTLGLSAGVVPCPAAIVVLLAAVAIGRIALGLGLIVVFSLGLAAVLIAIGVVAVRARALLDRFDARGAIARRAPIVSATLVTLLGAALTIESLAHR